MSNIYSTDFEGGFSWTDWSHGSNTTIFTSSGYHSSSHSIGNTSAGQSVDLHATYSPAASYTADQQVSAWVQCTAGSSSASTYRAGVLARSVNNGSDCDSAGSNETYYRAFIQWKPKLDLYDVYLYRVSSGSATQVGHVSINDTFAVATNYKIILSARGSGTCQLNVTVMQDDSAHWLTSGGLWSTTNQACITYTDTSSLDSGTTAGVYFYQTSTTSGAVQADDFSVDTADAEAAVSVTLSLAPSTSEIRDSPSAVAVSFDLAAPATGAKETSSSVSVPFNLAALSSQVRDTASSASVTLTVSPSPAGPADHLGSAAVSVGLSPAPSQIKDAVASIAATMDLAPAPQAATNTAIYVVAASVVVALQAVTSDIADHYASAADSFRMWDGVDTGHNPVYATASVTVDFTPEISASAIRIVSVSATDSVAIAASPLATGAFSRSASAVAGLSMSGLPTLGVNTLYSVAAAASLGVASSVTLATALLLPTLVVDTISLSGSLGYTRSMAILVHAAATVVLAPAPSRTSSVAVSVVDSVSLSAIANEESQLSPVISSSVGFSVAPTAGREISVGVVVGMGMSGPSTPTQQLLSLAAAGTVAIDDAPSVSIGPTRDLDPVVLSIGANATASVVLPSGTGVTGGDPSTGFSYPVMSWLSAKWPLCFAETPSGDLLFANGVDPMGIWNGLAATADVAGVKPPSTSATMTASGVGTILGRRVAWVRFIDADGKPSSLSPASDAVDFGWERPIDDIAIASNGQLTLTMYDHNLVAGQTVVLRDVRGLAINGTVTVASVVDADRFVLYGVLSGGGVWHGGGSVAVGASTITYSSVPTPTQSKVARRQILRNLEGSLDALYVDVDTSDLTSSSFSSSILDDQLRQSESVPMWDSEGRPWASRHAVPPSSKPMLATYMGRCFAAGDIAYTDGCVMPATGQSWVQGVATSWPESMAGRQLYLSGARSPYGITAVDAELQIAYLDAPVEDSLPRFCTYTIRSAPAERKLVAWSESAEWESWPVWNAIAVPDDGDEITALAVHSQALCVIERRHIYRMVSRSDPAVDGNLFLMAYRGAINNRCVVQAEGSLYMLDESGIHEYDGNDSTSPISMPIQTMFSADGLSTTFQVDWASDRQHLWHGCVDPTRAVVRWFVDFVGQDSLTHAVCYNYRTKCWWIEGYPFAVTSSCTGTVGYRRAIAGASLRRCFALYEGATDVVSGSGTLRGTVSSATSLSLTDSSAVFASQLAGSPVAIVSGAGKGQRGVIVDNTSDTITWLDPWGITPDDTSVYQIGGVAWEWRSGWFDVAPSETSVSRDIILSYSPVESDATLDATIVYDHSSTPETWGATWSADGVSVENGESSIVFDLAGAQPSDGYRMFRGQGHSRTYDYGPDFVQIQMAGVTNAETVRIWQVTLSGASSGEDA